MNPTQSKIPANTPKHTPTPYEAAWHGPSNGRGANQYAVQSAGNKQPVAWCDTLEQARHLAAKLTTNQARIKELEAALRAIVARVDGEWDNPALVAVGGLSTDTATDCEQIARAVLSKEGGK